MSRPDYISIPVSKWQSSHLSQFHGKQQGLFCGLAVILPRFSTPVISIIQCLCLFPVQLLWAARSALQRVPRQTNWPFIAAVDGGMHFTRAVELYIRAIVKSEQAQRLQNTTAARETGWKSEKPQKSLAYHRLYHLINILHLSSRNSLLCSGQAIWILHIKINALWKSFKAPNAWVQLSNSTLSQG